MREISLKFSRTARRAFLTFLSGGQNLPKSLLESSVTEGDALLNKREKTGSVTLSTSAELGLDLLGVLADGVRCPEDRLTMHALLDHRVSLHGLVVGALRLASIVDEFLLDLGPGLRRVDGDEARGGQLVVARPHDVLRLDRLSHRRHRYVALETARSSVHALRTIVKGLFGAGLADMLSEIGSSLERFFLLGELLNHSRKVADLSGLHGLRRQLVL